MDVRQWLLDPGKEVKWYYRPWFVIFMLVFFLGPLGLPLVYKSPRFNLRWKIGLTLLMLVYVWSLTWGTIEIVEWSVRVAEKIYESRVVS